MSKVVVSEFITLDGVFEDPGGSEKTHRGGWAFQFDRGAEGNQFKVDELTAAGALLLGRVTYEGFAQAWPSRTDEYSDRMNGLPKYVVSATLERGDWNNTTVLRGNFPEEVRKLKEQVEGDILIFGSGRVAQALMDHDLVDEYRLMVYPVVLGTGKRLFPEAGKAASLRLADSRKAGECLILIYRPPQTEEGSNGGEQVSNEQ